MWLGCAHCAAADGVALAPAPRRQGRAGGRARCSCCAPYERQALAARFGAPRALRAQVNSVHVHPVDGNLLLTGSNDWTARLTDLRRLTSSASEPDAGAPGLCC